MDRPLRLIGGVVDSARKPISPVPRLSLLVSNRDKEDRVPFEEVEEAVGKALYRLLAQGLTNLRRGFGKQENLFDSPLDVAKKSYAKARGTLIVELGCVFELAGSQGMDVGIRDHARLARIRAKT